MPKSLFDDAAARLEQLTLFDRLEARGTLRIALKDSGLEADKATFAQLKVVFDKVMPALLEMRAVSDAAAVCDAVVSGLPDTDQAETRHLCGRSLQAPWRTRRGRTGL